LSTEGPIANPRYPTNALPQPLAKASPPDSTAQTKTNATGLTSLLENPEIQ